ncbi:latent-transforming growth factor beta-binding protein 2-like [Myxocyprinus asiaticus]|uniref:latent-transforming growth factor beta-binding protein 2-like n=1 Tax=Myxocyprinus asiaticus TaxID=70543 RepID=UPI002222DD1C|nr:latent-transforming growth factor beta-binding protein 2-like [Myxocyprinus asiaticus]
MAGCTSTGYNYTCTCKWGYTGNGKECTDTNECLDPSACPNAKFKCVNMPGSVRCSCRYQNTRDFDDCELASGLSEYRINASSDTPHWYVMDYLTQVGQYYGICSAFVGVRFDCKHTVM